MSSPCTRSSSSSIDPVGQVLGSKFLSFAKSRLPVPNKPKIRAHRRSFLGVAPVPFAPLVDAHVFQPPPPYSTHPGGSGEFLPVPHNTPERSTFVLRTAALSLRPIGLGLDGVEKCDGERFDGLGLLSGGFCAPVRRDTSEVLREQVHQMVTEHAQRRRTRTKEQPAMRHDVFYASPDARGLDGLRRGTISSELKRAASLSRRASLSESTQTMGWRV